MGGFKKGSVQAVTQEPLHFGWPHTLQSEMFPCSLWMLQLASEFLECIPSAVC